MSTRVKFIIAAAVILVAIILILVSTYKVREDEQAILLQLGEPIKVVNQWGSDEPGLRFKTPFVQNVEYFEKRVLDFNAPAEEMILGDQKRLVVDAFIRYRIIDPLKFFQSVGNEAIARARLGAILNASTRQVLGTVELITVLSGERAQLMTEIRDQVNRQSTGFGVDVIDVRIRRADLPRRTARPSISACRPSVNARPRSSGPRVRRNRSASAPAPIASAWSSSRKPSARPRPCAARATKRRSASRAMRNGRDPEFYAFYRTMQAYRESLGDNDTSMVLSPDSEFFRFFDDIVSPRAPAPAATQ